jgi:hypothetical protein
MSWLFRPSLLLFISMALAVSAGILMFWTPAPETRPEPKPVKDGDQEIVFLYQATAASTWQRFVTAAENLDGWRGLHIDKRNSFPSQTTAIPELTVSSDSAKGRFVFRWYKLTSTQRADDWAEALLRRSPPPLAIIGGNTSDSAWEQATALSRAAEQLSLPQERRPLFLLTTATAITRQNDAAEPDARPEAAGLSLTQVYAGKTFRFCFTNQQMADAVTELLDVAVIEYKDGDKVILIDLHPDTRQIYTVAWDDDSYSGDLTRRFGMAVQERRLPEATFASPQNVPFSVGLFDRPNEKETQRAEWLIEDFRKAWNPGRPLLVVAGQSQPSRRFLRALSLNLALWENKFIVATGDTLAFNTVYRDRNIAWPIQELPFPLVFFCHRSPVSPNAGFQSDQAGARAGSASASGTEDLLLFKDIVRALAVTSFAEGKLLADADAVGKRLHALQRSDLLEDVPADTLLFDDNGNRRTGTGEHVVWLQPIIEKERVLPKAVLSVWARRPDGAASGPWEKRRELTVFYEGAAGGTVHGGD